MRRLAVEHRRKLPQVTTLLWRSQGPAGSGTLAFETHGIARSTILLHQLQLHPVLTRFVIAPLK